MVGVTGKMNGHERLHVAAFLAPRLRAGMHRTAGKLACGKCDRAGPKAAAQRDLARIAANVKRAEMASAKPGVEQ